MKTISDHITDAGTVAVTVKCRNLPDVNRSDETDHADC